MKDVCRCVYLREKKEICKLGTPGIDFFFCLILPIKLVDPCQCRSLCVLLADIFLLIHLPSRAHLALF